MSKVEVQQSVFIQLWSEWEEKFFPLSLGKRRRWDIWLTSISRRSLHFVCFSFLGAGVCLLFYLRHD